ncbi:PIR Superfamily Protein [Plasmodium ovale wallikeri]|uniref:PIR Superfamily Protein n=1 Tax=Plasmodium ovale wallikeri TaxID=864142 RepID=A0A1A9AF81_PLAOA|nr:PIR Superfamily Protein [Plasmodium ovale wallikeri]
MMSQEKSEKDNFFESWNKEVKLDAHSPYNIILNVLKDENNELYKIACSLTENYKNAHIQQGKSSNVCAFLNEWLNNKKRIHTHNGNDAKNIQLWKRYIEELWIHLEQETERNYWCRRIIPSSTVTNALSTSFAVFVFVLMIFFLIYNYTTIISCLHPYIYKKIRLKQKLHDNISNRLLATSSKYGDTHAGNKGIYLSYHTP